jgi:hypothetical protein
MKHYARYFGGLEFWAYMQAPGAVLGTSSIKKGREAMPPAEYLMESGTEG